MAGSYSLHAGLASHQSFRPNLYQTVSSSRVTSDPVSNEDEKSSSHTKHKSHRHHRDHSSRHKKEHHHSSSRRHAKDVVQSAIQLQPPTSFGDLLKQARGSKDTSPSHSRKGSVARGVDGSAQGSGSSRDVGITIPPRRPPGPEEVELERKRVEARERDLRIALKVLSDQSLKTSRRLDDTYYSILERASVLRQTIGSLQELSSLTKELQDNFESDTKELVDDVQGQFDAFDSFESQQQQIASLEERISAGKKKADTLNDRLTVAKECVDARSQSESEWHTSHTRRVRIFWGFLAFIATLIVALILFHQFKPIGVTPHPKPSLDFVSRAQIMDADIPDIAKEAIIGTQTETLEDPAPTHAARVPEEDGRLRVFDEL